MKILSIKNEIKCKNCKKFDDESECCSLGIVKNTARCIYEPKN